MAAAAAAAAAAVDDAETVLETNLSAYYPLVAKGKVREVYALDGNKLLFVATDRISAYDVVLKNGIPHKGALLTTMSVFWFSFFKRVLGTHGKMHFVSVELPPPVDGDPALARMLKQRSMQVRRYKVFPIESIVRGYLAGSAWAEYQAAGTVHGVELRRGMYEAQKLPRAMWTPSTKAEQGAKDENISAERAAEIIGKEYADRIAELSLLLYKHAADYALTRGVIIADTKFEFGLDETDGSVVLVDEVLTPDSSRFWPAKGYEMGRPQTSLDKQYLRDWLTSNGLKGKEGVEMPPDVVERTAEGYRDAFQKLVGVRWDLIIGDDDESS